jgi:hypothetical protein
MPVGNLIHADWGKDREKRWTASATASVAGFHVERLAIFDYAADDLIALGRTSGVLIGFDFPIGLPAFYARALGINKFREFLSLLSSPRFASFADPANTIDQVCLERPFYPRRPGGTSRSQLVQAHGVSEFNDLRRLCERPPYSCPAASPLFWTLGGNQVGRAAATGWKEVLAPLHAEGSTRFWPFDGPISGLTAQLGVTVAETYPADAARFLGIRPSKFSKSNQDDRRAVGGRIVSAAELHGVTFDKEVRRAIADGFPAEWGKDDGFDAVIGLIGLAAVLSGSRGEGAPPSPTRDVEGWILGLDGMAHLPEAAP